MDKGIKLNKKEILILATIGIILLAILIPIVLVSLNHKVELNKTRLKLKDKNNNISYYAQKDNYTNINMIVRNDTGKPISKLTATINFYDSNNELIATNMDYLKIILNPKETSIMQCNDYISAEYSYYKIEFSYNEEANNNDDYTGLQYSKGFIEKDSPDYLHINFKGKEKDKDYNTVVICTVFYKDKQIIGFSSNNVTSLEDNSMYQIKPRLPEDYSNNKIEYDYYELFVVN